MQLKPRTGAVACMGRIKVLGCPLGLNVYIRGKRTKTLARLATTPKYDSPLLIYDISRGHKVLLAISIYWVPMQSQPEACVAGFWGS